MTTLDAGSAALAKRSGVQVKLVDDSVAELEAITAQLDQLAAESAAAGVQGWHVDVPRNTVVVTVTKGASDADTTAIIKSARSFGDSVRIERKPASQAPEATAYLAGGFQFLQPNGYSCSVGFNTLDANNYNVVLTAGHCTKQSGWYSRNGYRVGRARTADFPADDFGTIWNEYPTYWQPSPSVYRYDTGTYVRLAGQWNTPPVGATVCKSGRTTGYTCGKITALNQTVKYPEGYLYGLVRHNACVEGGDSGGANISAGAYALGVTSGAALPASGKCLAKQGQPNVSWYQPVGEALTRNGLRLVR